MACFPLMGPIPRVWLVKVVDKSRVRPCLGELYDRSIELYVGDEREDVLQNLVVGDIRCDLVVVEDHFELVTLQDVGQGSFECCGNASFLPSNAMPRMLPCTLISASLLREMKTVLTDIKLAVA